MPDFQFAVVDRTSGEAVASGNSVPILWDRDLRALSPQGIDGVLPAALAALERDEQPTALAALLIVVRPDHRGKRLSRRCLEAMRELAAKAGLTDLVAPVRPSAKHRYPLTPIEHYAHWRRSDGTLFDPWMRVHERLGARFLRVAPSSMVVRARVEEWEHWTQMAFPESGSYVVPGALNPVEIDREADSGVYIEPNLWMWHRL